MTNQKQQLDPPDTKQCQAEKSNGYNFMTMGGRPELVRCTAKPTWIATERQAGADGLVGAMALCDDCKDNMVAKLGTDFAILSKLEDKIIKED